MPEGAEQVVVGNRAEIDIYGCKQLAVQRRQSQHRCEFFMAQHAPEHSQRLPQVVITGVGRAFIGEPPQASDAVVRTINRVGAR
jgi:hypothetical protein